MRGYGCDKCAARARLPAHDGGGGRASKTLKSNLHPSFMEMEPALGSQFAKMLNLNFMFLGQDPVESRGRAPARLPGLAILRRSDPPRPHIGLGRAPRSQVRPQEVLL